jgi:predicted lipoprotein with Yx(FWY)xxD motif
VTRRTTLLVAAVLAAGAAVTLVLVLARSPATGPPRGSAPVDQRGAVRVARTKLGPILVNGQGHTLYLFVKDRRGKSACYDACARIWPPATAPNAPIVGPGVAKAKLTTTLRRDHVRQLVYNGHPLYAMDADTRPGEMEGEGFLGTWFVVSPAGNRVVEPGAPAPGGY